MLQLIYTSVAVSRFTDAQLNELLTKSRQKNERLQITGMLLYDKGTFLQVIEGPDDAIRNLIYDIQHDPRHQLMIVLTERKIRQRDFSQWSMAFSKVTSDDLKSLPGYEDFFEGEPDLSHCRQDAWVTRRILLHFRDGMWQRKQVA